MSSYYMCTQQLYVSSYYICVRSNEGTITVSAFCARSMCRATIYVSAATICVLILLYMCPQQRRYYIRVVLMCTQRLYMCPHTTTYVSAATQVLYTCCAYVYEATIYVSSYYYICVRSNAALHKCLPYAASACLGICQDMPV
jgi:hypothetical protein